MRKKLQHFACAVFAVTALACGKQQGSSLSDTRARPLAVIAMGGHTSCNNHDPRQMGMTSSVMKFLDRVRQSTGQDPVYLISCHDLSSDLIYVTNYEPNTIRRAPLAQAYDLVRELHQDKLDTYLIGHSYGGWQTLQLANFLGQDENGPVKYLATIDPISRKHCFFDKPFGCAGWPQDVDQKMRMAISDTTHSWVNFYQTKTFYLRAAPVAEATKNLKIDYGHTGIESQPEVWDAIYATADLP